MHRGLQLHKGGRAGRRQHRGGAAALSWAALLGALAVGGALAAQQVFDLPLSDGQAPAERRTIRVAKGDQVVLRWSTDRRIALHLHGYDIEATVAPNGSASMSFTASIAGRFPVSEHRHGAREKAVLYLEVRP